MAIETTLIEVRNQKWHTASYNRVDSEGNDVLDSNGDPILDPHLDENGDPVKVINCEAKWTHLGDDTQEWREFTAYEHDTEAHGKLLYQDLVAGKYGAIADE